MSELKNLENGAEQKNAANDEVFPFLLRLLAGRSVKWQTLGEVLIRTKGTKITAKQMKEMHKDNAPLKIFAGGKTVAFVDFEDIPAQNINNEPSIIVKSRGIIEFDYYDKPFSHKNELWSYHSKNSEVNIKFVYYFLKLHEYYFRKLASKMQMPQIAIPDTESFKIPLPPLDVQEKIVTILDEFSSLKTELVEALAKEQRLRAKQYEYYREQFLTFRKELKNLENGAEQKNAANDEVFPFLLRLLAGRRPFAWEFFYIPKVDS